MLMGFRGKENNRCEIRKEVGKSFKVSFTTQSVIMELNLSLDLMDQMRLITTKKGR